MGVSISEYARQRGITEGAVRKAIKQRRISKEPNGTIDIERADKAWLANTSVPRINIASSSEVGSVAVSATATKLVKNTSIDDEHSDSDDGISYYDAKAANEILKAEAARLKIDEYKGKLIDRNKVYDHIFYLARQERDAWLAWPARIANQMAAEASDLNDPHQLQVILEQYVREHIIEIGEIKPNFTREPDTKANNEVI